MGAPHPSLARAGRPPIISTLYTTRLPSLARTTGISVLELRSAQPNDEALSLFLRRIDWFFSDFLTREEMVKERDGKITGELVVKALQKVFARSARHRGYDLCREYDRRRERPRAAR